MSLPNLTNSLIQPQNIVINQVPLAHTIVSNVNINNGIPITTHTPSTVEPNPTNEIPAPVPVQNTNIVTVQSNTVVTKPLQNSESTQVLTKQRLQDLIRETDSTLNLEDEVEEIILNYVDEFVDRCLNGAALIAKNRRNTTIEVRDLQQFLNRNYNMWTPGFGTDELRPYKRSMMTDAHKQRTALIRKTLKKY